MSLMMRTTRPLAGSVDSERTSLKRTLLLDADILCYTAASNAEVHCDWDGDGSGRTVDPEQAKQEVVGWINRLQTDLDADSCIICLSDPTHRYFRHEVYPNYKSARTAGARPLALEEVKSYLRDGDHGFTVKWKPKLEADDVLGILATHPTMIEGEKWIVTSDKDLKQIPGNLYNLRTKKHSIVSDKDAKEFFYLQTLMGDPTDGYPGCPKIGPVKGQKILEAGKYEWPCVLSAYVRAGKDEAYALSQARCARILQYQDYNFTTKEPILWTPPSGS